MEGTSPAPWTVRIVDTAEDDRYQQREVRAANGECVATIWYVNEKGGANALAVADAPEMHKLLSEAADALKHADADGIFKALRARLDEMAARHIFPSF